jgi:hypothetical protein
MFVVEKDPSTIRQYGIDLRRQLASGETITGLFVSSARITTDSGTITGTQCLALCSGGEPGALAEVHFTYTTSLGYTDTRTIYLSIIER